MAKKLQVFVSSTFSDLRDERQAAVAGVLLAGHIPAGMELFTAGDEAQLAVIKRWIYDSDIYMLILGARYGSIEPQSGLSYTELEYDYATELKKPSFAVVMDGALYRERVAACPDAGGEQHERFRAKVLSRISSPFASVDQMKLGIVTALRDLSDRSGLVGWVRSTDLASVEPLIREISSLQAERDKLHAQLVARPQPDLAGRPLAGLDEAISVRVKYRSDSGDDTATATLTWGEIFGLIAPKLHEFPADSTVASIVGEYAAGKSGSYLGRNPRSFEVNPYVWGTIRTQFEALGLVTFEYAQSISKTMHLYWHATEAGKRIGAQLRAVYSQKV